MERIEIGSGSISNNSWLGGRYDYEYNVPAGAEEVGFDMSEGGIGILSIGSGNGNATLKWERGSTKAYVHAWVNGKFIGKNRISWTAYAYVPRAPPVNVSFI